MEAGDQEVPVMVGDETLNVGTVYEGTDAPEGFTPDSPASFPRVPTWPAVLPSGAKVLLRRPNMLALLQRGDIPNPLIGVVQKAFMEGELADKARELAARANEAGRTAEQQAEYERQEGLISEDEQAHIGALVQTAADDIGAEDALSFIDVLVFGSVHAPKLTFMSPVEDGGMVAEDGKVSVEAIEDSDKMFVFEWAMDQLDGAATFRKDGAGADHVGGGGEVRDSPVAASGVAAD